MNIGQTLKHMVLVSWTLTVAMLNKAPIITVRLFKSMVAILNEARNLIYSIVDILISQVRHLHLNAAGKPHLDDYDEYNY